VGKLRTNTLTDLTTELMAPVRQFKPYAKFVRTINPSAGRSHSQERFAQSYPQFLSVYDYTLVVTNIARDKQSLRSAQALADLAATALKQPGAADAHHCRTGLRLGEKRWLLDNELRDYIKALRAKGRCTSALSDALFNEKSGC